MNTHPMNLGVVLCACRALNQIASHVANKMAIKSLGGVAVANSAKTNHADNANVQELATELLFKLQ